MSEELIPAPSPRVLRERPVMSDEGVLSAVNETMRLQSQRIDEMMKLLNAQQDGLRDVLHSVVELVTAVQSLGRDLEDVTGRMEDGIAALIVLAQEVEEALAPQQQGSQSAQSAPSANSRRR